MTVEPGESNGRQSLLMIAATSDEVPHGRLNIRPERSPFLNIEERNVLTGAVDKDARVARLLELFRHWDTVATEKEAALLPILLAPIAAALIGWADINYLIVAGIGTACLILYSYYLLIMDRFALIQLALTERLTALDYDEFGRLLTPEGRVPAIIAMRVLMLPVFGVLWAAFVVFKYDDDLRLGKLPQPPSVGPSGIAVYFVAMCLIVVVGLKIRMTKRSRRLEQSKVSDASTQVRASGADA